MPTGQIRFGREVGGRRVWLVSAGAVQGVRVGDWFDWSASIKGEWVRVGRLRVVGVSSFHAWTELVPGADGQLTAGQRMPEAGDWVAMEDWVPAREAKFAHNRFASDRSDCDLLLGLGVILARGAETTVAEVIPAYWWPNRDAEVLTPAAGAGIVTGDVLVRIDGAEVSTKRALEGFIGSRELPDAAVEVVVRRAGREVSLVLPPVR